MPLQLLSFPESVVPSVSNGRLNVAVPHPVPAGLGVIGIAPAGVSLAGCANATTGRLRARRSPSKCVVSLFMCKVCSCRLIRDLSSRLLPASHQSVFGKAWPAPNVAARIRLNLASTVALHHAERTIYCLEGGSPLRQTVVNF